MLIKFVAFTKRNTIKANLRVIVGPTINKISDDEFRLTDDHGGSVKLNKQELEYMAENFSSAVDSLKKETI